MTAEDYQEAATVDVGFEPELIRLPLRCILPLKRIRRAVKSSRKYHQIAMSIRQVGLVEPPVVARNAQDPKSYILLDGHLRLEVLKSMGAAEVECLVSKDDESYTYNKHISRLSAVQEHMMIVRAIEKGVPEDRIAKALDINTKSVRRKSRLLDGICGRTGDLLKDKPCPMAVFDALRQMAPARQIEAAEFMISSGNYSVNYANAMLAATPPTELLPGKPKKIRGVTPKDMSRIERELTKLETGVQSLEGSYGADNLNLVVIKAYLTKLISNKRVMRYLSRVRPEYLVEFQKIAEITAPPPQNVM